nr:DUF4105 domain-containing protein [Candidatus Dojkabacteria bacterium]
MKKILVFSIKIIFGICLGITIYMFLKTPSNNRNWIEGVRKLAEVEINENSFKINNVRNWRYGKDQQILAKDYLNIEYNYDDIDGVWFVEEPFTQNEIVAHTFFIFDFKNQRPIGLSIEARREEGEEYNMTKGLFRGYELYYNWATEQDLLSIRSVWKKNPMYMYPLNFTSKTNEVKLLKSLLGKTHELETKPEFYNTLTKNCTNSLAIHANEIKPGSIPIHNAWLFPGYADKLLYEKGFIPNNKPLEEIQQQF